MRITDSLSRLSLICVTFSACNFMNYMVINTLDRRQSKMFTLSMNIDQKLLETDRVFDGHLVRGQMAIENIASSDI